MANPFSTPGESPMSFVSGYNQIDARGPKCDESRSDPSAIPATVPLQDKAKPRVVVDEDVTV
jgi:hypothetical protein